MLHSKGAADALTQSMSIDEWQDIPRILAYRMSAWRGSLTLPLEAFPGM